MVLHGSMLLYCSGVKIAHYYILKSSNCVQSIILLYTSLHECKSLHIADKFRKTVILEHINYLLQFFKMHDYCHKCIESNMRAVAEGAAKSKGAILLN